MEKLLNPCADPIFKAIFTDNSDDGKKALTSLLTATLGVPVSNVKLLPNELPMTNDEDRQAIFDLTCVLDEKEMVNVEMQSINNAGVYGNRVEFHLSRLLNYAVTSGDRWQDIPKVYQISVLNFEYNKNTTKILSHYMMRDDSGMTLGKRFNAYLIELPKVRHLTDNPDELSSIQRWAEFFQYSQYDDKQELVKKLAQSEEGIMSAQAILNRISTDFAMWDAQNKFFDAMADRRSLIDYNYDLGHQEGIEEGRKEGMALGEKRGLEKGIALGEKRGLEEGIAQGSRTARFEMARNMKKLGYTNLQIAEAVNLSPQEIENL